MGDLAVGHDGSLWVSVANKSGNGYDIHTVTKDGKLEKLYSNASTRLGDPPGCNPDAFDDDYDDGMHY